MKCGLVVFVAISVCLADKLPDDFKWCKLSDPMYDDCFKDALLSAFEQLANGIPEIKAEPIEPLSLPSASLDRGQHVLTFNDLKLYNLTKMDITKMNLTHTPEEFEVRFELFSKEVTGTCNYTLGGKILIFTVDGHGEAVITFRDVSLEVHLKGIAVKGNSYTHYQLIEAEGFIKPTSAVYKLDNIINGNEALSKTINQALNENWDVLLEDFQPVFKNLFRKYFIDYANNILKYIPNVYE